jgi:hypothetical protein
MEEHDDWLAQRLEENRPHLRASAQPLDQRPLHLRSPSGQPCAEPWLTECV